MDGDLRYISLQYIKGDNYDEITCFKYERMKKLLGYSSEEEDDDIDKKIGELKKDIKNSPKELFDKLNEAKEKVNCKIGESFLNDLVNYYNFKDILELLLMVLKDSKDAMNLILMIFMKVNLMNKVKNMDWVLINGGILKLNILENLEMIC